MAAERTGNVAPRPPERTSSHLRSYLDSTPATDSKLGEAAVNDGMVAGGAIIEGSMTVPRHSNATRATLPRLAMGTFKGPPASRQLVVTTNPGHRKTNSAVLMTSSLDRRALTRPVSLLEALDPGPWEPMPGVTPVGSDHVASSEEEQASPTEDMPIGRPLNNTETDGPPDFDDTDPSITW